MPTRRREKMKNYIYNKAVGRGNPSNGMDPEKLVSAVVVIASGGDEPNIKLGANT